MGQIFISYAASDAAFASRVAGGLAELVTVFSVIRIWTMVLPLELIGSERCFASCALAM